MGLQLLHAHVDPAARELLADSENELHHALRELRELAHGIHPAALTDNGLADAVRTLAQRAPVPVTIDVDEVGPASRPSRNRRLLRRRGVAGEHREIRRGKRASITVGRENGNARIEIRDDGKAAPHPTAEPGCAVSPTASAPSTDHSPSTARPNAAPHHRQNPMRLVIADDTALVRGW